MQYFCFKPDPFWINLVQKIKIVSLIWNLVPRLIRTQNPIVMFTFSVFELQAMSKKFILHFEFTWFQQFTRRGLKPVALTALLLTHLFICLSFYFIVFVYLFYICFISFIYLLIILIYLFFTLLIVRERWVVLTEKAFM